MSDLSSTSWSETDASNNQFPPEGWPAGMFPNAVEPSARMNMGALKRFWGRINPVYTSTLSTTDSYIVSPSVAPLGYGLYERWRVRNTGGPNITTSPTINISSLGPQPFQKYNGAGALVNLAVGDLQNQDHGFWWNGTAAILENPATQTVVNSLTATSNSGLTFSNATGAVAAGFNPSLLLTKSLLSSSDSILVQDGVGGLIPKAAPFLSIASMIAAGSATGLKVTNNTSTSNTLIAVTANAITMVNSNGLSVIASAPSVVIDTTTGTVTSAANGMDGEVRPTSGWLYVYGISNGSTFAGLASTSNTAPTLPAGYTYKQYLGAMRCDGSQNLMRTFQQGHKVSYVVTPATNTANLPIMANGTAGNINTPTWVAIPVGAYVPPTAGTILVTAYSQGNLILAPNNSYGPFESITNPPLVTIDANAMGIFVSLQLESSNIYWANASSAQGCIAAYGWEDNFLGA
jgi:hypothetical protein